MRFSVIFAAESVELCGEAIAALKNASTGLEGLEIIVALGRNPSAQRNYAARHALGDYLLFLDHDSLADPRLLLYYEDALRYAPDIGIVGGPSVHEGTSVFTRAVRLVFSSVFGLGPLRSRYTPVGRVRQTNEHELILCNLLVKKSLFLSENGFNTDLYPGEENEFLNRIRAKSRIFHHPLAVCRRFPRATFRALVLQMFRYGSGRARHILLYPRFIDLIFFAPAVFAIYLLLLPLLSKTLLLPLIVYATLACSASILAVAQDNEPDVLPLLPLIFISCHFFYGVGLIAGFFIHPFSKKRSIGNIRIVRIQRFPARVLERVRDGRATQYSAKLWEGGNVPFIRRIYERSANALEKT